MTTTEERRRLIFGSACNVSALARETGIPVSNMRRYYRQPAKMPLWVLSALVRVRRIGADDVRRIIRGGTDDNQTV